MNMASEKMPPFIKLFGVVDGNGLSPFASEILTTQELLQLTKELFQPPKHDLHGINAADGEVEEEVYVNDSDENDNIVKNAGDTELSPNVVEAFMKDIAEAEAFGEDESNPSFSAETECNDNLEPSGNKTDESFFGRVDASKFFVTFKSMLESDKIDTLAHVLHKLWSCCSLIELTKVPYLWMVSINLFLLIGLDTRTKRSL